MYFNSAYMYAICVSFLIWTGNHKEDDRRKKQEEQEVKRLTLHNIQYKLVCDFFQEFKWTDVENNGIFLKKLFCVKWCYVNE